MINLLNSPNKNPTVKRTRSSLPVTRDTTTPSGKKPRLSLPNVKRLTRSNYKRLLRSTLKITEKIQNQEPSTSKIPNKITKPKVGQVAKKSTTTVSAKIRNVAVKRGKPYRGARESEPIFIDTNFSGQDIDMFINENDDDDSSYSVPQYSRSKSPKKRIRPCEVVIKGMPVIDRLLPAKKEPEILEPNVCELCDPKRIFLSKSSLADHMKDEHLRHSSETTVIPPTPPPANEVKSCKYCKQLFHSINRLSEHTKKCREEEEAAKQFLNDIPGINLSNLNKTVTISCAKKGEGNAPVSNYVCGICDMKFLMATGLKSHMKKHKAAPPPLGKYKKPGKCTCSICDKNFEFCSDLVPHMVDVKLAGPCLRTTPKVP